MNEISPPPQLSTEGEGVVNSEYCQYAGDDKVGESRLRLKQFLNRGVVCFIAVY